MLRKALPQRAWTRAGFQTAERAWRHQSGLISRSLATVPNLPDSMRAVVWRGEQDPRAMKIETLQMPQPKKGEVLVRVKSCGVCHTDLHCIKAEVPFPQPAVFGHEISAEVVGLGDGVTGVELGDKVACPFIMPCGTCSYCDIGEEDTCEPFFSMNRLKGHLYDDSTRLFTLPGEPVAMYSFGGLAEYAVVPQTAVFPLPSSLATAFYDESAIIGCGFFTAYGALRNAAHIQAGQAPSLAVCVIGCGGIGGCTIQLLRLMQAKQIIAVDVSAKALEHAKGLGAHHTINSMEEDVLSRINELTGGKRVDVCFEAIGLKQTFEQAIMTVRDGGRACYIGIADVKARGEVPITHIVRRRIALVGSYGARPSKDMPELLSLIADGGVDLKGAITRRFDLDSAGEAYGLLADRKIAGRAIVTIH